MRHLQMTIEGRAVGFSAKEQNGNVLVPLDAFCAEVHAEAKVLEENGPLTVCRDDLCIPLNTDGVGDTVTVDGVLHGRLEAFGEPLGLRWSASDGVLRVAFGQAETTGLGIGQTPPAFSLPDLYTRAPVAMSDFLGKKVVFYMWASW